MVYTHLLKPLLFRVEAERAHHLALRSAALLARSRTLANALRAFARPQSEPVEMLGLTFPNRVGLAAGMDKDAVAPLAWWAFGFGFLELGTVTPIAQDGNRPPRMFRYPECHGLVNRMGFNNRGAAALCERLTYQRRRGLRPPCPVGVSIGKNKDVSPELAAADFARAAELVAPEADFLTANISSPNTPGLRALQTGHAVGELVRAVRHAAPGRPLLVKVAPELAGHDLREVVAAALQEGASGLIATNTLSTVGDPRYEFGGLSGGPLAEAAARKVAEVRRLAGPAVAVIGVGGVFDRAGFDRLRDAGADLVQVYTGLVYRGPFLAAELTRSRSRSTPRLQSNHAHARHR